MAIFEQHPQARWAVPVAVLALVGGSGVAMSSAAQADAGLEPKTAEQLLVALQDARVETYSGTVAAKVDLGLGNLSGMTKRTTAFQNLADGTNTLRVWASGPGRQRVALVGDAGEADVIRNGRTVWTWNAEERTATQATLPAEPTASEKAAATAKAEARLTPEQKAARAKARAEMPKTPQDAARLALSKIDPTTKVTTNGYGTVAGRPVYELVLTPRTDDTLVERVAIDLDAKTSMPLRVRVDGANPDKPAIDVGFTSFSTDAPAASLFEFTPPKGATVTRAKEHDATSKGTHATGKPANATKPTAVEVGSGWAAVTVTRLPADAVKQLSAKPTDATASNPASVLAALPEQSGAWGKGRVFQGTLVSAVLTSDGRVAVGAVPSEKLFAALASPAAASLR